MTSGPRPEPARAMPPAPSETDPVPSGHAPWMSLLRVTVAVVVAGILIWRLRAADLDQVLPDFGLRTLMWLFLAVGATGLALVAGTVRWQRVLHLLGADRPVTELLHHAAAAQFVGNVLPSTVGGDVLRVRRLGRDLDDGPTAFASVVVERLSGWLVLPAITFAGFVINPGLARQGTSSAVAFAVAIITLTVLIMMLWAAEHPNMGGRVLGGAGHLRRHLGAVHLCVVELRRRPRHTVDILLSGLAYQGLLVLAAFFAARAIGIDLGPTAFVVFIPAVLVVQVLPLSISGLGLREGALVLFFHSLGVDDAESILLGLLMYVLTLVVSLAGAPSFALGGRPATEPAVAAR